MFKPLVGGVAAATLAITGLGVVAGAADATQHHDAQVVQTTVTGNGWLPNAQGPGNGSITSTTAPDGETAAKFTTMGDGTIETLFGTSYAGTQFSDISGLSYSTFVQNSNFDLLAPSIGVEVWGGTGNGFRGSMVYEPYVGDPSQPVQDHQWQQWDASSPDALWWSTRAIYNQDGSVLWPAQQAHTLAEFEAAFAANPDLYGNLMTQDGVKIYVGESTQSSDWDNFTAYVDNVHVATTGNNASDTDWDFTTGIGSCAASENDPTKTWTLLADCSTYSTLNVDDGWTVDGAGHTITAVEDSNRPTFTGAVIQSATGDANGPASMNVENLNITTQGFGTFGQNSGGTLAGIRYDRAGGSVSNVSINGISHGNGVQEGNALYFRNRDASGSFFVPRATVTVDHLTVTNYQKTGVIFDGNLGFTMTNSNVGPAGGPDGGPLTSIAANSVQVSRDAHGTIADSTIGLNEYNPNPPPGDGSDATGILLFDAKTVNLQRDLIAGDNGDVGVDAYNDTQGVLDTHLNVSCSLFSRSESQDDPYDAFGVGIAQYDDGSTPVDVQLSDSTFSGWHQGRDTATISYDENGNAQFGPGAQNQSLGNCPATAPTNVALSGGDQQTDVTWNASSGKPYAPLQGYTVTATGDTDGQVITQAVGPGATTTHLVGLTNDEDWTISVVANSNGGDSPAATAVLHSTTLALNAADSVVEYGGAGTTLNGTLSSTDPDADYAGRQVTIESRPAGQGDFTALTTATVNADGSFSAGVTPAANTDYRAVYAGEPDNSSMSSQTTVNVSMLVTLRASSNRGTIKKNFLFTGVVSPSNSGGAVELQVKKGNNGDWTTVKTGTLDAQSSYGFNYKFTSKGHYSVRVLAYGDATHVDGYSDSALVTIHRAK